jgi:hypothetical protein
MPQDDQTEQTFPSTTWEWRRVKIKRPPEAMSASSEASPPAGSLLPWPRSKPITVVLKYRGGPEGWVEVRARGRVWRRPGTFALYDTLCLVFGWQPK